MNTANTLPNGQHLSHLQILAESRKGQPSPAKGKRFPIEVLTPQEVKLLLKQCNPKCPTGSRNRALLALLYRGMLRVSEALSLHPRDVDLSTGMVNVRSGKGNKQRIVGLDSQACTLLQLWMNQRIKLGIGNHLPIFTTLKARPLRRVYVWHLVKRLARKAGISKRVHPHSLRHAGASELVHESFDLVTISQQLGHSNVSTTHRYISHLCPHKLVAAMNSRSWDL